MTASPCQMSLAFNGCRRADECTVVECRTGRAARARRICFFADALQNGQGESPISGLLVVLRVEAFAEVSGDLRELASG